MDVLPTTQPPYPCEDLNEILTYDESTPYITALLVIHWLEQIGGVGLLLDARWMVIDDMLSSGTPV